MSMEQPVVNTTSDATQQVAPTSTETKKSEAKPAATTSSSTKTTQPVAQTSTETKQSEAKPAATVTTSSEQKTTPANTATQQNEAASIATASEQKATPANKNEAMPVTTTSEQKATPITDAQKNETVPAATTTSAASEQSVTNESITETDDATTTTQSSDSELTLPQQVAALQKQNKDFELEINKHKTNLQELTKQVSSKSMMYMILYGVQGLLLAVMCLLYYLDKTSGIFDTTVNTGQKSNKTTKSTNSKTVSVH